MMSAHNWNRPGEVDYVVIVRRLFGRARKPAPPKPGPFTYETEDGRYMPDWPLGLDEREETDDRRWHVLSDA